MLGLLLTPSGGDTGGVNGAIEPMMDKWFFLRSVKTVLWVFLLLSALTTSNKCAVDREDKTVNCSKQRDATRPRRYLQQQGKGQVEIIDLDLI